MVLQNILDKLPDNTEGRIKEKDLRDCFGITWDKMLKKDLSDLTDAEKQNIKTILGIGNLPTNLATIDENSTIGNTYTKEQTRTKIETEINLLKNGVGSAYDTLKEIETYIDSDSTATASIISQLATKANVTHTHLWADITNKPTLFNSDFNTLINKPTTYPATAHTHDWASITSKPTTFTPSVHTHLWADLTDKPTLFNSDFNTLINKPTTYPSDWNTITNKPASFAPTVVSADATFTQNVVRKTDGTLGYESYKNFYPTALVTPTPNTMEYEGAKVYMTNSVGVRKQLSYTDDLVERFQNTTTQERANISLYLNGSTSTNSHFISGVFPLDLSENTQKTVTIYGTNLTLIPNSTIRLIGKVTGQVINAVSWANINSTSVQAVFSTTTLNDINYRVEVLQGGIINAGSATMVKGSVTQISPTSWTKIVKNNLANPPSNGSGNGFMVGMDTALFADGNADAFCSAVISNGFLPANKDWQLSCAITSTGGSSAVTPIGWAMVGVSQSTTGYLPNNFGVQFGGLDNYANGVFLNGVRKFGDAQLIITKQGASIYYAIKVGADTLTTSFAVIDFVTPFNIRAGVKQVNNSDRFVQVNVSNIQAIILN